MAASLPVLALPARLPAHPSHLGHPPVCGLPRPLSLPPTRLPACHVLPCHVTQVEFGGREFWDCSLIEKNFNPNDPWNYVSSGQVGSCIH